jgi:hypothetical protein
MRLSPLRGMGCGSDLSVAGAGSFCTMVLGSARFDPVMMGAHHVSHLAGAIRGRLTHHCVGHLCAIYFQHEWSDESDLWGSCSHSSLRRTQLSSLRGASCGCDLSAAGVGSFCALGLGSPGFDPVMVSVFHVFAPRQCDSGGSAAGCGWHPAQPAVDASGPVFTLFAVPVFGLLFRLRRLLSRPAGALRGLLPLPHPRPKPFHSWPRAAQKIFFHRKMS